MQLHEITVSGEDVYDPESRTWVPRRSHRGVVLEQLMQLYRFHRLRRAANYGGGEVQRGHKRAGNTHQQDSASGRRDKKRK
jgi:hypothetical protein